MTFDLHFFKNNIFLKKVQIKFASSENLTTFAIPFGKRAGFLTRDH